MAALPAYVAVCSAVAAAWSEEYSLRAWCRVELMMAYSFMAQGLHVFVVEESFKDEGQGAIEKEAVQLANPADGMLTNELDRAVIDSLTKVAVASRTFSCRAVCYKNACVSWQFFCVWNLLCCCQCCGLCSWWQSRDVRPGRATLFKLTPVHRGTQARVKTEEEAV